ncbi:putative gustatory receptor clone PTE03 [Gadus chalcogrammus]|uniref:putative gustatory receptor clone PTE03 n=1 Tax=Gadus chalcogrammus TaxID=1042646 RepID=UPI0024C4AA55|nr:putative gustatory receptor clone PTE03 [Gadus chalcogrammus]
MVNSSQFPYFILTEYLDMGYLKYLYFVIVLMLYIVIVVANAFLIVTICMKRSLHEPMYVFLCSLLVNELYGSAGLIPFLLLQITSDSHTISRSMCFLQIYCLHTYATVEFCNLAVMSYDRYLAICCPLHYKARLTSNKVALLIALVWLYSLIKFLVSIFLTFRLKLCGNVIGRLYCQNYYVTKLACSDTTVNNVWGLFATFVTIGVPLFPIVFSYTKILRVCVNGSKETRQKAVSTCSPHIASLLIFTFGCGFEIFQSRYNMTSVPRILRIVLSLYFVTIQGLFNPIIYGLRLSKIRQICRNQFFHKKI